MQATFMLGSLLLMLVAGMPIAFALGLSGAIGLYAVGGAATLIGILKQAPLITISNYELLTMPMFILMAQFVIQARIAEKLFDSMVVWLGRARGGLAIATALFGAGFAAISGSSIVGAATLASTSSPAMLKHGYEPRFANGVVAISGTLGMLIPPSIALILYSILTELSTAKVLIAGLLPGIVITAVIVLTIRLLLWLDPTRAPATQSYPWRMKLATLRNTGPLILLFVVIIGSLYSGLATPVETSAVAAFAAFWIAVSTGHMNPRLFASVLGKAARTSAMVAAILIGASIFGYAMTLTQTTQMIIHAIAGLDVDRYVIVTLIILFKLSLGFFLDQTAILILTVPIMVPVIKALGFDPIWFGVIVVLTAEVGQISPPVGLNVFIISRYTGRPPEEIFAGALPHIAAHLFAIALFVAVPEIVTYLPNHMR